jgi:hypothetical protein
MARDVILKPKSAPTGLHNYLPEPFTFYWDKEAYTLQPGETLTLFEWLATHGAMKMAERWFHLNPQNPNSPDSKVKGFYTRHEDSFKKKVNEALIYPKVKTPEISETKAATEEMNTVEEKPNKREIELKTAEDDEPSTGCHECKATGPRHKPTCPKFKPHEKDEAQATRLKEAASRKVA